MPRDRPDLDAFGRPLQPADASPDGRTATRATADPVAAPGHAPRSDLRPDRAWSMGDERAPAPVAREANPQAVAALVCGILGFVAAPVVLSIAAIALGTSGVRRADALPGTPGRTMARVGRALGWGSLVLFPLLFLVAVISGS